MSEIECPYCGKAQEINHDDGYGYEEDTLHEQECLDCEKIFTFSTSVHFYYKVYEAECLNGGDHKYKPMKTAPKFLTKMRCLDCEKNRQLTELEWLSFMKPMEVITGWYK